MSKYSPLGQDHNIVAALWFHKRSLRRCWITSSNIGNNKSFVYDLNRELGIVRMRVALVPRSAEIKPLFWRFVPQLFTFREYANGGLLSWSFHHLPVHVARRPPPAARRARSSISAVWSVCVWSTSDRAIDLRSGLGSIYIYIYISISISISISIYIYIYIYISIYIYI